jgi:hypothetical protein
VRLVRWTRESRALVSFCNLQLCVPSDTMQEGWLHPLDVAVERWLTLEASADRALFLQSVRVQHGVRPPGALPHLGLSSCVCTMMCVFMLLQLPAQRQLPARALGQLALGLLLARALGQLPSRALGRQPAGALGQLPSRVLGRQPAGALGQLPSRVLGRQRAGALGLQPAGARG